MTKFKLNMNEIEYIKHAVFLKEPLKHDLLNNTTKVGDGFEMQVSDDQIEEGKILENLIDKISDL